MSPVLPARLIAPTAPPAPADNCLRMAPLLPVPGLIAELGQDPWPMVAAADIAPAWFDEPDRQVPYASVGRLLALAQARTACPHLGLLTGMRCGGEIIGPVWGPMQTAPTVGAALRQLLRYLHLHDRAAVPVLWHSEREAMLGYVLPIPDVPGVAQVYDAAAAICRNILLALCGPRFVPLEVRLCRPPPADPAPYREFYRTRVRFGAAVTVIVFDARWLTQSLPGADALQHARCSAMLAAEEAAAAGGLATRLQRLLRRLLVEGASPDETAVAAIARRLTLHERTLNRRLRSEGTSYKALIDSVRFDVARQLLRDTRLTVADIAAALDYADAAAFTRAFQRWAGQPPGAWRASHPAT